MKYQGSKRRIAKEILTYILANRKDGQWFVEPFCGGCNLTEKVSGNRMANDYHYYLISMYKALQNGWIPPSKNIGEPEYNRLKKKFRDGIKDEEAPLIGFVGFGCAFGSIFFTTFARDPKGGRDYTLESFNNVTKQLPKIKDVVFTNFSYEDLIIPPNSIIYCDPPYKDTTKYSTGDFNHDKFYQWCRDKRRA